MTLRNEFMANEHQMTTALASGACSPNLVLIGANVDPNIAPSLNPLVRKRAARARYLQTYGRPLLINPISYEGNSSYEHARANQQGLSFTYLSVSIDARPQQ